MGEGNGLGQWNAATLKKAVQQAQIRSAADKFGLQIAFGGVDGTKSVGNKPVDDADGNTKVQIRIAENKNSQCALAFMIKRQKKMGAMANLKTTTGQISYSKQFANLGLSGDLKQTGYKSRWKNEGQGYSTFKYLNGTNPASLLNTLVRVPEAMSFFNLASVHLSKLTPYIKFYLLDPLNKATELPFSTKAFGETKDSSLINILNSSGVNSLDVGLQEVSFDLLATNPAELNNTIECKVKIYLNNLGGLLKDRKSPTGRPFQWKDLIERKGKKGEESNVKDNKVRLVMGWMLPSEKDHTTYEIAKDRKIVEALALSRYSLIMYLRDHTLDIKPDGSAVLSITYNAYAEGALNHPSTNILGIKADQHQSVQKLKKRVNHLRKEREKQEREDKRNGVEPTTRKPDPDRSKTGEATGIFGLGTDPNAEERARASLGKAKDGLRNSAYQQLMKNLYHRKSIKLIHVPVEFLGRIGVVGAGFVGAEDELGDKRIYQYRSNTTLGLMCSDHIKRNLADILDRTNRQSGGGTWVSGKGSAGDNDTSGKTSYRKAMEAMVKMGKKKKGERTKEAAEFLGKGEFMKSVVVAPTTEKGKKYAKKMRSDYGLGGDIASIPFTYIGDIIDAVLWMLYQKDSAWSQFFLPTLSGARGTTREQLNKMAKDKGIWPTIMTGPILLYGGCVDDKPRMINIGDVPVTIQSLTTFLINNLVRPQRATWRLRDFLWSLMSELLPTALGYQCMDQPPGGSIMPRMEVFHLPSNGGNPLRNTSFHIDADKFRKLKEKPTYQADGKTVTQYDALILFATYFNPINLKGSEKQDVRKGIYHLRPGVDGGPIKSYSFSRNDQPFLAEAKVFGSSDIGQTDDISGGSVYNITMKMVGNGFFSPGQMVYIDLTSLGFGSGADPKNISFKMNVGGYYLITKVSGLFSPSEGFLTTVEAIWQSPGVMKGTDTAAHNKHQTATLAYLKKWGFKGAKIDPDKGVITATHPTNGNKISVPLGGSPEYDEHSRWNARDGGGTTTMFSNPALAAPYAALTREAAQKKAKNIADAKAASNAATAAGYRAGEGTTFD